MTYSSKFYGSTASGSSKSTASNFQNGYGSTLSKGTPVSINTTGLLVKTDVSNEALVLSFIGLCSVDIPNGATGAIMDTGRLEDITTSFSVGDSVYVSAIGDLTNVKPNIGGAGFVAGDGIIFVGVITKGEFNPLLKDIKLLPTVFGLL